MDTGAAREQISQARSQIADAKSQAQSLRTENQTIQEKLNSARGQILSQRGLRSGRDINAVVVRNKQIGAIEQTEGQIAEREKAISQYESDIAVNEQAVNDYEEAVRDYEDRMRKQTQSDNTIYVEDVEQSLQMSLNPELRKKIDDELKKNKYQYSDDVVNRINSILGDRVKKPDITQIEEVKPLQTMSVTEPVYSEVHDARPTGYLGKLADKTKGYGFVYAFTSGIDSAAKFAKEGITHPIETSKNIGKSISKTALATGSFLIGKGETPFASVGETIREKPGFTTGVILREALLAKGTTVAVDKVAKVTSTVATRLDPRFRPVVETTEGNVIKDVALKSGKIDIPIAERIPTQTLAEQAAMAGTTRNVISGARDLFGVVFKRTRNISKPIPKEAALTPETKLMLKQFDEGKLSADKIPELNRRIIQESGSKGLLERSFFADPNTRLRPSRLGLQKEKKASIIDILSGDVSTVKPKPQAILLEQQKIQKFPKKLADVEKALKEGKPLTQSQQDRLLQWQLDRGTSLGFDYNINVEKKVLKSPSGSFIGGYAELNNGKPLIVINKQKAPSWLNNAKTEKEILRHEATHVLNKDINFFSNLRGFFDFKGRRLIKNLPESDIKDIQPYPFFQRGAEARARIAERNPSKLIKIEDNSVNILKEEYQFKPIGFISGESEVTAFGGILKRESTPAVTIINGKRVPIIKASIVKPSGELSELMSKGQLGKLTVEESNRMNKLLKSETGLSYADEATPYYNPYKNPATVSVTSVSLSYSEPIKSSAVISVSPSSNVTSSPVSKATYSKSNYYFSPVSKPVSTQNYNPPSPNPEIIKSPRPISTPNYTTPNKPNYPLITYKSIVPPKYTTPRKTSANRISKVRELLRRGYKTFVVRGNKKTYLPGTFSRGEAIKRGETSVLSNLSATFGVEETNSMVRKGIDDYKVRSDIFRDYKIRKGNKIGLKDTWIQKAGTGSEGFTRKGARLSSYGEINELKNSRRFKWF